MGAGGGAVEVAVDEKEIHVVLEGLCRGGGDLKELIAEPAHEARCNK